MDEYGVFLDTDGEVYLKLKDIRAGGSNADPEFTAISLGFNSLYVQSARRAGDSSKLIMTEKELWDAVRAVARSVGESE